MTAEARGPGRRSAIEISLAKSDDRMAALYSPWDTIISAVVEEPIRLWITTKFGSAQDECPMRRFVEAPLDTMERFPIPNG